MNITVFQALTLLAQKYRNNPEVYPKIKSLYLSGVRTKKDWLSLNELFNDDLLKNHEILGTRQAINNDPVRRYFESYLCHETLAKGLDSLNFDLLNYYYAELTNEIKTYNLWANYQSLYQPPSPSNPAYSILIEYYEGIRILKRPDSYQSLKPNDLPVDVALAILAKRKIKMQLFSQISLASWYLVMMIGDKLPLKIYWGDRGPYNHVDRGRFDRKGQTVQSQTMGILRSYMPLSSDDVLLSEQPALYIRPADKAMFVPGAKQPDEGFKSLVSPFSNSLSGTLLAQLKMMAQQRSTHDFIYANRAEQLSCYFKLYIAYMIFHSGGHSLDEYARVFQLAEVKDEFKSEPAFQSLTLENLFKEENNFAFEEAVSRTIDYNDIILNKRQLNMTLPSAVQSRQMNVKLPKERFSCKAQFFEVGANHLKSASPTSTTYDFESIEDISNAALKKD